ncbi:LacI family DNA-binding transcriptional regulator [Roseibium salinum]|uniref:LacI family DNA-binding transcriptional regulator n=1 Tax=Roseibium salinum TaxID=1604349 RepID=A0ABT3QWT3_9HYPH|nr:LacI family DNA-binding transcriptional regulator [Roseibium sp. DSM 29163]MCX2721360.1 LacI family DNA-binding transcriptional regulator [Roseibium sp. DSM 29163]
MMDVAAMAGVSQATVSLVLNGSPGAKLSDATKKRVHDAARELGYTLVRRGSRAVPEDRSNVVFIADEITTDPWMALAFEGARDKAYEFGIHVSLAVSHGDRDTEQMIVSQMSRLPLLGFIYGTILTRRVDLVPALEDRHTILLNCYDGDRALPSVLPGDVLGGRTATDHLIQAGYRRIGLINGQQGVDASRDRLKGYRQALSSNDIPFDSALVKPGNWEPLSGYQHTHALLDLDNPPDAIFCANDLMALGCYDALKERGLRVPEDIAVIGFDNREISESMHPPLSTLVLPHYEMGEIAFELLLDNANGRQAGPGHIKVECPLVERNSVTAPAILDRKAL